MSTTTTTAPAIWVGDLAAYNAGILHGEWIKLDAEMTIDELDAKVKAILAEGTRRYCRETLSAEHEEWMISDYEGFGPIRIGEYSSLSSVLEQRPSSHDDARALCCSGTMPVGVQSECSRGRQIALTSASGRNRTYGRGLRSSCAPRL